MPRRFRATVHGLAFANRDRHLNTLAPGDELLILPGPPLDPRPGAWVHLPEGDLLGHLPPEIERWIVPWMLCGGHAHARVLRVDGPEVPSWRRLLIQVTCEG